VLAAGELSGRSVLVVGGGPIGQLCCRLAGHYGAAPAWLSEPSAERRGYAEASQADHAFDPTTEAADIERLKADVVLECSGGEPGIRSGLAAARPEGTVIVVGGGRSGLDPIAIILKELRVLGSFTYADEFAAVIALLADGVLQVADLTSEIASLDDAPAAFDRLRDANTTKILIAPNGP
jgi:(R,R)-butanediol dehydrogenase/meso-butanediol dehydrogenase/diacetyl reductase